MPADTGHVTHAAFVRRSIFAFDRLEARAARNIFWLIFVHQSTGLAYGLGILRISWSRLETLIGQVCVIRELGAVALVTNAITSCT